MGGGLDDLARELAGTMPRRRALRVLAGGIAVLALPGRAQARPRPTATAAQTLACDAPGAEVCLPGDADHRPVCCPGPNAYPTCCMPNGYGPGGGCCACDQRCGPRGCEPAPPADNKCPCPPDRRRCGPFCCYPGQACIDFQCVEVRRCPGPWNRIDRVETKSGSDHGLAGTSLMKGQQINALDEDVTLVMGSGGRIRFKKGSKVNVSFCADTRSEFELQVGDIWAKFKKAVAGSDEKFKVTAGSAVTGVRGTTFSVRYDPARKTTTVHVTDGVVSVRGIRGARGRVTVRGGQKAVQRAKGRPRLVRR